MVNLRKLLTNICTSIKTLLDWKTEADSEIDELYNAYTLVTDSIPDDTTITLPSGTYKEILSVTFTPGSWIYFVRIRFPYSSDTRSGVRYAYMSNRPLSVGNPATSNYCAFGDKLLPNGTDMIAFCGSASPTVDTTYYLVAYQNSGKSLSIDSAAISAHKLN